MFPLPLSERNFAPNRHRRRYLEVELLEDRTVPAFLVESITSDGGSILTLPAPTISVQFNAPVDAASVDTGDLELYQVTDPSLHAQLSQNGQVINAHVQPDGQTVVYTLDGLIEGSLAVRMQAGAVTDDQGIPVGVFSDGFRVDVGTLPFNASLESQHPGGSLVYHGTVTGQFTSTGTLFVPIGRGAPEQFGDGSPITAMIGPKDVLFGPDGNGDGLEDLYVSVGSGSVLRFDGQTGDYIDLFAYYANLGGANDMLIGPDGNGDGVEDLYVVGHLNDMVVRFDGVTGSFIDEFIPGTPRNVDLDGPFMVTFGPDATGDGIEDFYVTHEPGAVKLYNGSTGDYIRDFVALGDGSISVPIGMSFGPDADGDGVEELYIANFRTSEVLRYHGADGGSWAAGDFLDVFVSAGAHGIDGIAGLHFSDDQSILYVNGAQSSSILKFDGATGTYLGTAVAPGQGGLDGPHYMMIGPDGAFYVASFGSGEVLRFDDTIPVGPGDVDEYTIELDSNQTLTVHLTTIAAASLTVTHSLLGAINLPADSDPAQDSSIYQSLRFEDGSGNPVAGTVTVAVQAADSLTGASYDLDLTFNAVVNSKNADPAANESLDSAAIAIGPGSEVLRTAAAGTLAREVPRTLHEDDGTQLDGSWDLTGTDTWSINAGNGVSGSLNKKFLSWHNKYDGSDTWSFYAKAGDVISIRTEGAGGGGTLAETEFRLLTPQRTPTAHAINIPGRPDPALASASQVVDYVIPVTGEYFIEVLTASGLDGDYLLNVDLQRDVDPRPNTVDQYSFSVDSAGTLSVAAATGKTLVNNPNVQLQLLAPNGNVVGTSNPDGALDAVIHYEIDASATGVYTVRVTPDANLDSDFADYSFVATINGILDNGANNIFSSAQNVSGWDAVLGRVDGPAEFYQLSAGEGDLTIISATPGDGPAFPGNALNPQLVLLDGNGATLAVGAANADGRNETLSYTVPVGASGVYFLKVAGEGGTIGAYVVSIDAAVPPPPSDPAMLVIDDVTVDEGNSGTVTALFTVTRSGDTSTQISVYYNTVDGSATSGSDYEATGAIELTFFPGDTTKAIPIQVIGDTDREGNETFFVNLSNPSAGVVLVDDQGTGTIKDDDKGRPNKLVAASLAPHTDAPPITAEQVESLFLGAFDRLAASGFGNLTPTNVTFHIVDLDGRTLGASVGNAIFIDINAAGWGWFVDPTPWDDSEFTTHGDQGEQDRMDLLTVIMHEMGHLLGHEHEVEGVMQETLAAGERHLLEEPNHEFAFMPNFHDDEDQAVHLGQLEALFASLVTADDE